MRLLASLILLAGCSQISAPASSTEGPDASTATPDTDGGATQTGLTEIRAVYHVHSVYSHDACDGEGIVDGEVEWECWRQLREAVCASRLDFVALADHPDYMRDYNFEHLLLHDSEAGDELFVAGDQPYANRIACEDGHRVLVNVGYERKHTMPIGLHRHVAPELYSGIGDGIVGAKGLLDGLREAGAVTAMAHSEEDDISAQYIVDSGIEAMEWYNPHGNFQHFTDSLGDNPLDALDALGNLESFLDEDSGTHPDLSFLILLQNWPEEGFRKWREVNQSRGVVGLFGNDVHQNTRLTDVCSGGNELLCQSLATAYPNTLTKLLNGGHIILNDNDRFDSYLRAFRWLQNRTLVEDKSPAAVADALRRGRNYGLFAVFGEPEGFSFAAVSGDSVATMGSTVSPGATLYIDAPQAPTPTLGGAPFDELDAKRAELRLILVHTSSTGSETVREVSSLGESATFDAIVPGAYHVEVWLKPYHLESALGPESALADREYLWVITNPIRID
jgi:hypothetical protein